QQYADEQARTLLVTRAIPLIRTVLARPGRHHWPAAGPEDEAQNVWLGVLEAIDHFKLDQPGGCHFMSYLWEKLRSREVDFRRHQARQERLYQRSAGVDRAMDHEAERDHLNAKYQVWFVSNLDDPALIAERRELTQGVARVIEGLEERPRYI